MEKKRGLFALALQVEATAHLSPRPSAEEFRTSSRRLSTLTFRASTNDKRVSEEKTNKDKNVRPEKRMSLLAAYLAAEAAGAWPPSQRGVVKASG